jgi:hypothetical protein
MAHYVEYIPDPHCPDDPDEGEFNGTWTFSCDSDTTSSCRWTSDCDCEVWTGMSIATDGSSATHTHYRDVDEIGEDEDEEIDYPMTVAPCQLLVWFDEDDRDWLEPTRVGRQKVLVEWDYDYYVFGYAEVSE